MGAGDDRAAFDRLIVESIPAMLRFATRLCGNPTDAEDIVQDALLRAARNWRSFRGDAKISTWLFRIVINAFRDRHRESASSQQDIAATTDPSRQVEAAEFGAIVAAHVSSLPPRQREVLVLIAYEQMSSAEAAAVLGISEQSVRTNLHFARERMREKLAKYVSENARE